jgi:hypothetical protein
VLRVKLLLPDSVDLDLSAPPDVQTLVYSIERPVPVDHTDAEVLVVWGNPPEQLRDAATRLTRLKWVQTLAAGPDEVLAAGFRPGVVITAGLTMHDTTVAEHVLALVLAAARRVNLLIRARVGHRWAGELGGRQPVVAVNSFRTLRDARGGEAGSAGGVRAAGARDPRAAPHIPAGERRRGAGARQPLRGPGLPGVPGRRDRRGGEGSAYAGFVISTLPKRALAMAAAEPAAHGRVEVAGRSYHVQTSPDWTAGELDLP